MKTMLALHTERAAVQFVSVIQECGNNKLLYRTRTKVFLTLRIYSLRITPIKQKPPDVHYCKMEDGILKN
jgi:hypothetical protein